VEELLQPRDSFKGHSVDTPWSRLQLAYFAGYAMWTYLNTPFLFASAGVDGGGGAVAGKWRDLEALKGYLPAEHRQPQHRPDLLLRCCRSTGILVPTKRRVSRRGADGTFIPDPLIVSIDLTEVEFS
jgi:hypothetical protein